MASNKHRDAFYLLAQSNRVPLLSVMALNLADNSTWSGESPKSPLTENILVVFRFLFLTKKRLCRDPHR